MLHAIICGIIALDVIRPAFGHGFLQDPPARSSMWRFGFDTPKNYNDNQLFCGGYEHQWVRNNGKCGVCGDPWDGVRDNEAGGRYATGTISRRFKAGQIFQAKVRITASHLGYFEFRLCPNNNPKKPVTQKCLDKYVLHQPNGNRRFIERGRAQVYTVSLKLPAGVTCTQCVLQWKYNAGNSYGTDGHGIMCKGCGQQEQFYGCADIAIDDTESNGSSFVEPVNTGSGASGVIKPIGVVATSGSSSHQNTGATHTGHIGINHPVNVGTNTLGHFHPINNAGGSSGPFHPINVINSGSGSPHPLHAGTGASGVHRPNNVATGGSATIHRPNIGVGGSALTQHPNILNAGSASIHSNNGANALNSYRPINIGTGGFGSFHPVNVIANGPGIGIRPQIGACAATPRYRKLNPGADNFCRSKCRIGFCPIGYCTSGCRVFGG